MVSAKATVSGCPELKLDNAHGDFTHGLNATIPCAAPQVMSDSECGHCDHGAAAGDPKTRWTLHLVGFCFKPTIHASLRG
jgi:hypothetical protein